MENVLSKFAIDIINKRIWSIKHPVCKHLLENLYLLEDTLQGALNVMRNSFLWDIQHRKNELSMYIENTRLKNKPIPQQAFLS